MRRSRGFASTAPNFAPVKTRFRFGSGPKALNLAGYGKSPDHYAKGTRSGISLTGIALPPLVGMWFQVQCPPLVGVLPIFRSRYSFAIGHQRVLSLTGWAPWIRTHFHVLSPTQDPAQPVFMPYTGLSPCVAGDSTPFYYEFRS